jgi:hypothetical protein
MEHPPPEALSLVQLDIQAQFAGIREPDARHFSHNRPAQGSLKPFVV